MLQWARQLAVNDAKRYGGNDNARKHWSQNFSRILVYASGERVLGFPGPVPDATNTITPSSICFNVSDRIIIL